MSDTQARPTAGAMRAAEAILSAYDAANAISGRVPGPETPAIRVRLIESLALSIDEHSGLSALKAACEKALKRSLGKLDAETRDELRSALSLAGGGQ